MALTDKNIVITPNIGQANDPKIDFTGANANTSGTITLTALPANGGTVQFAGAAGTLLALANTVTNTVVSVPSTLNSTSTTTGALTISGGVGIGRDLRVGGSIYGTFAGSVPISVTNNNTSATTQYLVFVSTSSGNVNLQVSAPTGITYQPSTGNFGLGVPNPSYRLDMSGGQKIDSATGGYIDLFYNGAFSGNIQATSGALFVNTATNTNTLINANGGNVGVRQSTPLFPLHITADSKKQLTVSNGSGSTTKQAGINYRIDSTDLWQTYVNNASNNNWYIRYNDTLDVFTADTSGNIGIGTGTTGVNITTPAPGRYLEIYAPGTTPAVRLVNDAATPAIYQLTAGIPNISTTGFSIWNEGTGLGVFNIDSLGRGTINTQTVSNSNFGLEVWNSIGASGGSVTIGQGGAYLSGSIFSNATYGMIFRAKSTPSAAGATFAWATQANTELLRLDPNGNLGFGTTAAFEKFVMLGSANTATHAGLTYNMVINSSNPLTPTNPSGVGGGIALGGIITGTTTATFAIVSGVKENANYNDNAGAFIIGTRANGALVAEAMRVTSGKLVGIGTTTPLSQLHVKRTSNGTAITLENSTGGVGSYVDLDFNTYSTTQGGYANAGATIRVIDDGAYSGHITFRKKGASIGAAQSEIVRFDTSGNVIVAGGYIKLAGGIADNSGTGSALNVLVPGGGSFAATASSQTGAIKIRLPQGYTDTMIRMTVKVYTYDGASFDITCGGYQNASGSTWYNTFAYLNTRNRGSLNVRFGYDGTYNCIFIGEINTTWSYPQVFVTDFQAGYNNYAYTQWVNNWNISFFSTAAFANTSAGQYITSTVTAYPAWTTGSLTNVSQLTNDAGYITAGNTIAKYTIGNNGVQPCWIYLGRWNTAQQGYTIRMTITGMQGYNAAASQNQTTLIYFKTSNASSNQSGSSGAFYADGQAYRYGANTNGPQTVRVVQVDQSTYDFYTYWPGLVGQGSMYEVSIANGTWVNSCTVVTPSGNYLDLTWYTMWTSQSLTALSQLTNDVPFYKSGDSPNFNTVNLSNLYWRDSGGTVGNGMLNMTAESQILFNGSPVLGDGVNADILAFYMPNTAEYYNGTSWSSTAATAFYDAFRGKNSNRFGGPITLNTTTQQRIRFTWNSWGYKFWNGIVLASSLQGNSIAITMETSADGTTWTTQINDVNCGSDWPGYHYVRHISNNSGSSPWLRITLRHISSNANTAYINNISIIGSYGGYANLFDWDYSRNVTFPGNVYAPVYYDANNSSYYADPAGNSQFGRLALNTTSWDSTNLVLDVNGNASFRNGFYMGISNNNYNSWTGRIYTSSSNQYWNGQYWEFNGTGWSGGVYWTLDNSGNSIAYGSHRAPIFYDKDDTTYYADPNSTSKFNALNLDGTLGFRRGSGDYNTYIRANGYPAQGYANADGSKYWVEIGSYGGVHIVLNTDGGVNSAENSFDHFTIWQGTNNGNRLFWSTNTGNVSAASSLRAPIFYDLDDTTYYVDPNSFTNLFGGMLMQGTHGTTTMKLRLPAANNGAGTGIAQLQSWVSEPGNTWDWAGFGFNVDNTVNEAGNVPAYYFSRVNTSFGQAYMRFSTSGALYFYNNPSGTTTRYTTFALENTGYAIAYQSMRSPIFYDYDNTNYYVDPASTSILNNLTVSGTLSLQSINPLINGPLYTYYSGNLVANATQAQRFEVARIYQDTVNWKTSGMVKIELHNYYYTGNDYQVWMVGYHGTSVTCHMVAGNAPYGRWAQVTTGTPVQYSGNIYYLPIYVDVRYYAQYYTYVSTDWPRIATTSPSVSAGYGAIYIFSTPSATNIADFTPNTTLYTTDIITSGASVRAPVWYDLDNTGYYVDANSISSMYGVAIRGDSSSTDTSNQIFFWGSGNSTTSSIGFKASGGYFSNPTGNGDGYNTWFIMDTDGRGWVFRRGAGGTNFGTGFNAGWILNNGIWVATSSMRAPIFYDQDNTNYYLDPNSTTNIKYLKVNTDGSSSGTRALTIKQDGQGEINFGSYPGPWSPALQIQDNNSSGFLWLSAMTGQGQSWIYANNNPIFFYGSGGFAGAAYSGSLRSPIFYDYDNTGYYANPAGQSFFYQLNTENNGGTALFIGNGSVSTSNRLTINFHTDGDLNYYIGKPAGGWTQPLHVHFYTGIRLRAHQSYDYGTSIWNINTGNIQAAFGYSGDNVYLFRTTYVPFMYDYDNTGYYIDMNGTSNVNVFNMQGGGVAGALYFNGASGNTYNSDPQFIVGQYIQSNVTALAIYVGDDGRNSVFSAPLNGWGGQDGTIDYLLIRSTNQGIHHIFGSDGDYAAARIIYAPYGSVRSPIFYDYDNTGYYVDPNSTTNLYALTVNQQISGNISGYSRYVTPYIVYASNGNPISGTTSDRNFPYYGMYTYHTYGNTNITPVYYGTGFGWGYGAGGSAEIIANWVNGGNPSGIYWRSLRDCCSNWTNWTRFLTVYDDPYAANMNQYVRQDDQVYFYDVRAYIYYDRNNTGYYVDPASTSNFNAANFQGRTYNYNYVAIYNQGGIMGDYNASGTAEKVIWTIGESWPLGNMYGLGYQYSSSPYIGTDHCVVVKENGGTYTRFHMGGGIWTNGPLVSSSNSYIPISYDYNDTGYYTDPNSYTNLNYVTSRTKDRIGLTAKWNTPRSDYIGDSNYWTGTMGWGANDANTIMSWGNGFFDSWSVGTGNNFPPSTSHFEGIQSWHYTPYGGYGYGWQMVNGGGSTSVWFRPSWPYPGSWQNFAFYGINNYSYSFYATILYDSDNTGYFVDPNSTSRIWYLRINGNWGSGDYGTESLSITGTYPSICLRSTNGNNKWLIHHDSGSSIQFYWGSTWDNNSWSRYAQLSSDQFHHTSSLRAPIFYDYDNTGYYADLNGFMRSNSIGTNYIEAYNAQSASLYQIGLYYSGGGGGYGPYFYSPSNYAAMFAFHKGGYYAVNMGLDADNVIRIGGWSASSNRWQLDMSGNMYAAGNITAYSSDQRLKKNIKTIENPVEMIRQLRGVYFDWHDWVDDLGFNPIDRHDIGVIAQEVQAVIPMAIKPAPFDTGEEGKSESGENYLTVQLEKIVPLLIEVVKHQQDEIEELKKILLDRHKL